MYKTNDVKDFEEYLSLIAHKKMEEMKQEKFEGRVALHLDVVFGDRRKRDLQNCFGSVCDALNNIVYKDDSQIYELSGSKEYEKDTWTFEVTVTEIEF